MSKKVVANILRVFVNEKGEFGNPVGVVADLSQEINPKNRQEIATRLGFSESVFIDNLSTGEVSIFNPINEVAFAGHALIGTAYFVNKVLGKSVNPLECKGGKVMHWQEGALTWIQSKLKGTPPWNHKQLSSASQVENISKFEIALKKHLMVWAWIDETKGTVRARTFAPDWGITEDQGNGSGSMQLATILGRSLEIHHGEGSVIYAKPADDDFADVGGMVKENLSREITL